MQAELSCLLGLVRAGYEVYFVEASGQEWEPCYDPATRQMTHDPETGLSILQREFAAFGLGEYWCYINGEGQFYGFGEAKLRELCGAAEFLFSRAGTSWREEFRQIPKRIYLDVDPAFTQMRMPSSGTPSKPGYASVSDFTDHFTLAANVGLPGCRIPLRGLNWQPAWPFYVPELYADLVSVPGESYTTVMSWDAYGEVEWDGETYGQKNLEFPLVAELPRRARLSCKIALAGGSEADRVAIREGGWKLVNANEATRTRKNYLAFIGDSRGELSICKNGYAKSRSGWFSDRTLAYLALGRPAVVQDTGLRDHLPVGRGLHLFSSTEEALEGLRRIEADYAAESRAAQDLAREYFSAEVSVAAMLRRAGVA